MDPVFRMIESTTLEKGCNSSRQFYQSTSVDTGKCVFYVNTVNILVYGMHDLKAVYLLGSLEPRCFDHQITIYCEQNLTCFLHVQKLSPTLTCIFKVDIIVSPNAYSVSIEHIWGSN